MADHPDEIAVTVVDERLAEEAGPLVEQLVAESVA